VIGAAGTASSPATALGADDTADGSTVPKMTREHAIRIIQRHERGRQGLVRVKALRVRGMIIQWPLEWLLALFELKLPLRWF